MPNNSRSAEAIDRYMEASPITETAANYEQKKFESTDIYSISSYFYKIPNYVLEYIVFSGEFSLYQIRLYLFLFSDAFHDLRATGITRERTKYQIAKLSGIHISKLGPTMDSLINMKAITPLAKESLKVEKGRKRDSYKRRYFIRVPEKKSGKFSFVDPSDCTYIEHTVSELPLEQIQAKSVKKAPEKTLTKQVNELIKQEYGKDFSTLLQDTITRINQLTEDSTDKKLEKAANLFDGGKLVDIFLDLFHLPTDLSKEKAINQFMKDHAAKTYNDLVIKIAQTAIKKFTKSPEQIMLI